MSRRALAALSAAVFLFAGCASWPSTAGRPTRHPHPSSTPPPPSTTSTVTSTTSTTSSTTQTTTTTSPQPHTACYTTPGHCGYPDASNTGYRRLTPGLAAVKVNSDKVYSITRSGVYDALDIPGCVEVHAPNVTIQRSWLHGCDSYFNIRLYPGSGNFVLVDSEVDGSGAVNNAAFVDDGNGPVTMRRVDMHHVADGPHPGEHWLIEDSWIHDLTRCGICHNDTVQSAGAVAVTVRHNTLENLAGTMVPEGGMNAAVRIATEQGPVQGFVVENNLLVGGNYAVQVRSQGNGAPQGVQVVNNRIVRGLTPDNQPYPRFGAFDFTDVPGVVVSGNVWDDTGATAN